MKILIVAIGLILTTACHSNNNSGSNADSTKTPGNSAGATTISADTTHMDTSLGRIMTDSAK